MAKKTKKSEEALKFVHSAPGSFEMLKNSKTPREGYIWYCEDQEGVTAIDLRKVPGSIFSFKSIEEMLNNNF